MNPFASSFVFKTDAKLTAARDRAVRRASQVQVEKAKEDQAVAKQQRGKEQMRAREEVERERRAASTRATEGSRARGASVEGYPRTHSPRQGRHPHLLFAWKMSAHVLERK